MAFTAYEIAKTRAKLTKMVETALSKEFEPDVLLGNHPASNIASIKQSIAIKHGKHIEANLASWIEAFTSWSARSSETFVTPTRTHEIDVSAFHKRHGVVLAIEVKRKWSNQDKNSAHNIRSRNLDYADSTTKAAICGRFSQPPNNFRYFVFDAYGDGTDKKHLKHEVPIIPGDSIVPIFGESFVACLEWERLVLANALFEEIDQQHVNRVEEKNLESLLRRSIEDSSSQTGATNSIGMLTDTNSILEYIDSFLA